MKHLLIDSRTAMVLNIHVNYKIVFQSSKIMDAGQPLFLFSWMFT